MLTNGIVTPQKQKYIMKAEKYFIFYNTNSQPKRSWMFWNRCCLVMGDRLACEPEETLSLISMQISPAPGFFLFQELWSIYCFPVFWGIISPRRLLVFIPIFFIPVICKACYSVLGQYFLQSTKLRNVSFSEIKRILRTNADN